MVKSEDDLAKVAHLIPASDPGLAHEYRNLEVLAGEEALVRAVIYGPIDHAAGELMSVEDMMVSWMTNRPFAERFVGMFAAQVMAQTRAMCEAGVRHFFIPYYWHSLSVGWSPATFEEWFLPMVAEQVGIIHAHDGVAFYYDDGKLMGILPFLAGAGVDVVETCTPPPVGDFDLETAKRLYGDKITFMGYTDLIYVLQRGSPEDVRRTVEHACRIGGRGFILGTSDSMREGTCRENVDTYFAAARRYGRQPR
jgi:uroporphyrinogen-III decarboxylase